MGVNDLILLFLKNLKMQTYHDGDLGIKSINEEGHRSELRSVAKVKCLQPCPGF